MAKETKSKATTTSKKDTAGVAKAAPVASEVVEVKEPEKKVEAPTPKKVSTPTQKLIKVKNVGTIRHYQASSGMRISVGETKDLYEDDWLKSMVKRRLFEVV